MRLRHRALRCAGPRHRGGGQAFAAAAGEFEAAAARGSCDADRRSFALWEEHKDVVRRLAGAKQRCVAPLELAASVCERRPALRYIW